MNVLPSSTSAISSWPFNRRQRPDRSRPQQEHHQPRFLSEREYKVLLDACRHEIRDSAIIELLLQTGMRLCELSGLKLTDVQLPARISKDPDGAGCVHILGKGWRERTVTLNWKACKAIRAYLTVRPKDTDDQHLFLTKFRLGISHRSIERVVEKHLALMKTGVIEIR